MTAPPATTYWLLAEPGKHYVAYARGLTEKLTLQLGPSGQGAYRARQFNPRTGEKIPVDGNLVLTHSFDWTPPDSQDWVLHLARRVDPG